MGIPSLSEYFWWEVWAIISQKGGWLIGSKIERHLSLESTEFGNEHLMLARDVPRLE